MVVERKTWPGPFHFDQMADVRLRDIRGAEFRPAETKIRDVRVAGYRHLLGAASVGRADGDAASIECSDTHIAISFYCQ